MCGVHEAELRTSASTTMLGTTGCSVAQGLPEAACGCLAPEQAARLASSMLDATRSCSARP